MPQNFELLVSACLAGFKCRYDGGGINDELIKELVDRGKALSFCPEVAAGLSIPRPRAEIHGGDGKDVLMGTATVVTEKGLDVSKQFIKGACMANQAVIDHKIKRAILKANSPSCGRNYIYSGMFDGRLKPGNGVTTALLLENDIEVISA